MCVFPNIIRVFAENERLAPEPDTLAFLIRMGADIREIQVRMEERRYGQSYLSPVNASKYMLRMLSSILFLQKNWEKIDIDKEKTRVLAENQGG